MGSSGSISTEAPAQTRSAPAMPDPRAADVPPPPLASPHAQGVPHFVHLSSLGILLVVLAHGQGPEPVDKSPELLYATMRFINSAFFEFRMPLFFFISGYLFLLTTPPTVTLNYTRLMRKKALRLLLPYVALTSVAFPVKCLLAEWAVRGIAFTPKDYLLSLLDTTLNPVGFFWFMPALFVVFLASPALRWMLFRGGVWVVGITVSLLAAHFLADRWESASWNGVHSTWMGFHAACSYAIYFWIGMLGRQYNKSRLFRPVGIRRSAALACLGLVLLIEWYWPNEKPLAAFVAALAGVYAADAFIHEYYERGWTFLKFIDGRTYQIYLLSWFVQQFVIIALGKMLHVNYWVCVILASVGGLVLPVLAAMAVERWLPIAGPLLGMPSGKRERAVSAVANTPTLAMR